ncbi:MAG: hypothetical protein EAZ42_13340 [Verrucomicrobia bacterium]|nr:MAG: hypothetical protein EAZ42_13340 [Verrucomicrobiota bacterium]
MCEFAYLQSHDGFFWAKRKSHSVKILPDWHFLCGCVRGWFKWEKSRNQCASSDSLIHCSGTSNGTAGDSDGIDGQVVTGSRGVTNCLPL